MASKENITKFVQNRGDIHLMKRMLASNSIPHVNVVDTTYYSYTALMYQIWYGTIEAMEFLLTCDPPADLNAKSAFNLTILQQAADKNESAQIRLLLEHDADRDAKGTNDNLTALEYAKKHHPNNKECIEVLESYFPETRAQRLAREAREAEEREAARQKVLKVEDSARHFRYSKEDKCLAEYLNLVGASSPTSSSSSSKGGSASGSQPLRDSSAIIKQGYLQRRKKGVLAFGRWELSYFVLSELSLQYFRSEKDFKGGGPPKVALDIEFYAVSKGGSVVLGGKTCFVISIVAPKNEQFDVACATEAERVDWMRDLEGRNIKASSNMLYLATLLKIKVDISVGRDQYLCRFSLGGSNNSFNIKREWQLNLTYQDMSNMYSSLEKKGLLSGIQWKGFELPSEQQTKSDVLFKDKMWHFLERVVKTYPYPREVVWILKLDSELLPYLDSTNRSISNGLRRVADVWVDKVDVPCGNAAEYMFLTSSLIEFRNKLRYDQLMYLIKGSVDILNHSMTLCLVSIRRALKTSSSYVSSIKAVQIEDLVASCQFLLLINEDFYRNLTRDPTFKWSVPRDFAKAESASQLIKHLQQLSFLLDSFKSNPNSNPTFNASISAVDAWLSQVDYNSTFEPLFDLDEYLCKESEASEAQYKAALTVHMNAENPNCLGLSRDLTAEYVSLLNTLEEYRDQDEVSSLDSQIEAAMNEFNNLLIQQIKSQRSQLRIGSEMHNAKGLLQLLSNFSTKVKEFYSSLVDKDFCDSSADVDVASRCVATIRYLSDLSLSLPEEEEEGKDKATLRLRLLLSRRKRSSLTDESVFEEASVNGKSGGGSPALSSPSSTKTSLSGISSTNLPGLGRFEANLVCTSLAGIGIGSPSIDPPQVGLDVKEETPLYLGLSQDLTASYISLLNKTEEFVDQDKVKEINNLIENAMSEFDTFTLKQLNLRKKELKVGSEIHSAQAISKQFDELINGVASHFRSLVSSSVFDELAGQRCSNTIKYLKDLQPVINNQGILASLLRRRFITRYADSVVFPDKVKRIDWADIRIDASAGVSKNDLLLGSGSFSDVVKAQLNIKRDVRDVAVKILRQQQSDDYSKLCEVALNEADIIASSTHRMLDKSGIVTLYGVVMGPLTPELSSLIQVRDGQSRVGIVLSYEPSSLHKVLYPPSGGLKLSLSVAQKLSLVKSLTDALRNLHIAGCVHGDLKPQNILLSGDVNSFQVKLADFNTSDLKEVHELTYGTSILQQTSHFRGTKGYCAVEQLPDPSNPGAEVAKASRRTDIFSLAVIIWEIFSGKSPHHEIGNNEGALCLKVHNNGRPLQPSVDEIPEMPAALREMLKMCWDANRSRRLTSVECFSIVNHLQNVLISSTFDIFLSHCWVDKELLSHVYALLTKLGFRVWYDKNEMGYDMQKSMRDGVGQSKVFLCCFNSTYETRPNCAFELDECKRLYPNKPVVALLLESISGSSWKVTQEMQDKLQLNAKMFCDIHKVASNSDWRDPNTKDCIAPDLIKELEKDLQPLIKILADLKCTPSLK